MVMSMDTSADQTISSPPLPQTEDPVSPSAIMSSPSLFHQQESADDEHEDEHSKGSNQTVVAKHHEHHSPQVRDDNITPVLDERVCSTEDHQEKMIVSRGSSFDGDKKLEMNVDDEYNGESSMRTDLKFDSLELETKLTQHSKISVATSEANIQSSLVAQMRDIVEGSSSRLPSGQKKQINEQGQPKSSSDSLNNQNDNNTSKASIDSATGHKRTRHSRAHQCRHHHNHHHHHQHRHRPSVGGTSIAESQADSGLAASSNAGPNPSHSHYQHHHHHRHSNTGQTNPNHRHHHHHHHHSGHHHHHNHDKNKGTSSKRNSILRLTLNESVSGQQQRQQQGKNESNSSVSSVSLTKQGQPSNNPNQSQPESGKSSGSPSDEQIIDAENQESTSHDQQASKDGHLHHHSHHHHHHCHRSHKKRLVLSASNNQPADGVIKSEESSSRKKPLQDSSSGMNVESTKYHDAHHHNLSDHSHHHHHHAHHHHHPHHHHHHHAHSIHYAEDHGSSNKDLTDPSQQQPVTDDSHQNHHHQLHHKHHLNHHYHGHHCRHNRNRNRGRSGSKADNSLRNSGKNLDSVGAEQDDERRLSIHPVPEAKGRDSDEKMKKDDMSLVQDENESRVSPKEDDVVNMDISPKNDRKASQVTPSDQRAATVLDPQPGKSQASTGHGDALQDSEIGGSRDTSRKHDSSCNFDRSIQANQENINARDGPGGGGGEGHNRLSRQISSQSSKKSLKDSAHGAGLNQQGQQHNECTEPSIQVSRSNQQSSRPKQVIESSVVADRRCRLCWCCCCPCSALNVREAPDRSVDKNKPTSGPPGSPTSKYPNPPNVSLDEVRSWGESFDKLMKCTDGRKVFQDFLRCEYSEENILFWSACEDLKKERDSKSIAARARDIYEDYISILSSREVSLDSRVRDVINNNIKKPTSNIFDEAQLQIYTLMHRDSYPRFINSGMYKKLAQIATSSSRKSSS